MELTPPQWMEIVTWGNGPGKLEKWQLGSQRLSLAMQHKVGREPLHRSSQSTVQQLLKLRGQPASWRDKYMLCMPSPVIDLFAGPGGLAEGFSRLRREREPVFRIGLSIERDTYAHGTLDSVRSIVSSPMVMLPLSTTTILRARSRRDDLFKSNHDGAQNARSEAWKATLGVTNAAEINSRIITALGGQEDWLLIGGPPCQAYSLAGRSKIIGQKGHKE